MATFQHCGTCAQSRKDFSRHLQYFGKLPKKKFFFGTLPKLTKIKKNSTWIHIIKRNGAKHRFLALFWQFFAFFCHFGNFPTLRQVCQIEKKTSQDIYNILAKSRKRLLMTSTCQKKIFFGTKIKKNSIWIHKINCNGAKHRFLTLFWPFLIIFCDFGNFLTLRQVCQIKKKTSHDIDNILASCQKKIYFLANCQNWWNGLFWYFRRTNCWFK